MDAINYMLEIWRVLKIGGLLVLISTMPPEILEPMAIAPLEQQDSSAIDSASSPVVNSDGHDQQPHSYRHSSGGDGGVSNWKAGSRVQQLTTAEGGTVYYYTIRKLTNTSKVTTFHPAAATTTTTSTTTPTATAKGASALKEKSTKDNKSGVGRKGDTKGYECVKEDIMAGITALLEEARKAKEQMEAAASKV